MGVRVLLVMAAGASKGMLREAEVLGVYFTMTVW